MELPLDSYPCILCQESEVNKPEKVCEDCITENNLCKCPNDNCSVEKELRNLKLHHAEAHDEKLANLVCKYCGTVEYNEASHRKYCSDCNDEDVYNKLSSTGNKVERVTSVCENCENEFKHKSNEERTYCSTQCYRDNKGERLEVECEMCGDKFTRKQSAVKQTEHTFCSKECTDKWLNTDEGSEAVTPNHPKETGELAEGAVVGELSKKNICLLEPRGDNQRYDFVIDNDGEFIRLQCKHARVSNGKIAFNISSTNYNTSSWDEREDYKGDVEYFVAYSSELDKVYLVPIEEASGSSKKVLRIETPKHNEETIDWAEEYRLENRPEIEEWSRS